MTRDELLALIDQAAREKWTKLDLHGQEIAELPPEIGQLTNLTTLNLYNNKLIALPPEIGQLTNLVLLNLDDNQLEALPPEIGQLIGLIALSVSYNQLEAIPPEIGQLFDLQRLQIRKNKLAALPSEIGQLVNLSLLYLDNNRLVTLPSEIGQLANLRWLDFSHNGLIALPSQIGQLSHLKSFSLSYNTLATLPREIGQLTDISTFDLKNNELAILPPEIGQLTNLSSLDLSNNQFTALPPEIGKLTKLPSFNVSNNHLTALPSEIGQLPNLSSLDLSNNQLTVLPPEIGQLINLKRLSLRNNQLTTLPPEIGQLTGLQSLVASHNQLTTLPPEIGQLISLRSLDLSENQLSTLPETLRHLTKLNNLHVFANPLPLLPELTGSQRRPSNPKTFLKAYFQANRPLREAKLLLVGEGSVGKTSLVERLLWGKPPSDSGKTIGVDIHEWAIDGGQLILESRQPLVGDSEFEKSAPSPVRLNVWDFGGQEIYHATHQFFLTHRSIYLLVIESRKDEAANRLDYWLRLIQSFASDAPVILVVNKIDQHPPTLDERGLMLKYPTIQSIIHTSCTEDKGINRLRRAIAKTLATIPHINDWVPLTWFAIKEQLAQMERDYLPYESYVELCKAKGIDREVDQRILAQLLHDLGAALNFQDDRHLAGTHVLNPEWVTSGIYSILNEPALQGKGILRLSDLSHMLDGQRYPRHKHPFLLDIMGKFELCVPLNDRERYLIPGLLPKERPSFSWPKPTTHTLNGVVALEYRYAILPSTVLSRLMVRLHSHTWQNNNGDPIRWRNGLVLARDGCRALVIADPAAARLTIALDGPAPHRRHLLTLIRAELDEIHASFAKLEAEEWVPIPDKPGKAIPYIVLAEQEARGEFSYYDPYIRHQVDVRSLLDGIESLEERNARVLVRQLSTQFDLAELRQFAFEMDVDYEELSQQTKTEMARELVLHFERRGRLTDLERKVREERPYP